MTRSAKKIRSTVLATNAAAESVQTIHGETIAVSELTHIAPYLHRFAIRVDVLRRDPENARKHGKKDLSVTSNAMSRFGQTLPVLFRPDDKVLIVGNGRHEAASNLLDWTYIAAAPFAGTREQAKAYGLADNRTAELSEWDTEKLSNLLDELGDVENLGAELEDFQLEEIGLGGDDLAEIEEQLQERTKKKASNVEPKTGESVAGQFFNVVIKCGSEKTQLNWEKAIQTADVKLFLKLCVGAETKLQN